MQIGMTKTGIERIEQDAKNHEETRRSETFKWLRRDHARIVKALARCSLSWASVAANIAADGIRGPTGREPSAKSVQQIWVRVCKQVEKEKRAALLARGTAKQVNRSPRVAKPLPPTAPRPDLASARPVLPPPVRAPPVASASAPQPLATQRAQPPELTDAAREELENLKQDFRRADAWAPPALGTWKR
jgi:hypothetical protein